MLIVSPIPMKHFTKDHWSLLAYVGHCVEDNGGGTGHLALEKLRCNEKSHPLLAGPYTGRWQDEYTTRIKAGETQGHDDWDCLDDLEAEGLVYVVSTIQGWVNILPKGLEVYQEMLRLEQLHKKWADFHWPPQELEIPSLKISKNPRARLSPLAKWDNELRHGDSDITI